MKVLALQKRGDKENYYVGYVIGERAFERKDMAIFHNPPRKWNERMFLIRMSNGEKVKRWESDTFIFVNKK